MSSDTWSLSALGSALVLVLIFIQIGKRWDTKRQKKINKQPKTFEKKTQKKKKKKNKKKTKKKKKQTYTTYMYNNLCHMNLAKQKAHPKQRLQR